MGVEIDELTDEQAHYLASWDEGTLAGEPMVPRDPSFFALHRTALPAPAGQARLRRRPVVADA